MMRKALVAPLAIYALCFLAFVLVNPGPCSLACTGEADWEQVAAELEAELVMGMTQGEIEQVLSARSLDWSRSENRLDWILEDLAAGPLIARYGAIVRHSGGLFTGTWAIMITVDVGREGRAVRVLIKPVFTGL